MNDNDLNGIASLGLLVICWVRHLILLVFLIYLDLPVISFLFPHFLRIFLFMFSAKFFLIKMHLTNIFAILHHIHNLFIRLLPSKHFSRSDVTCNSSVIILACCSINVTAKQVLFTQQYNSFQVLFF